MYIYVFVCYSPASSLGVKTWGELEADEVEM